jgi:polysaccharide pyruvyl transferase WcaK-like protein/MoaA/NifB/PqqE/SkfB family radical SAM enzyme
MCNIWQCEPACEISLPVLGSILSEPLFKEIQHIDITGGEPTMRPDLPEIGQILIKSAPKLKSLSIITNALDSARVIERTMALAQATRASNIHLNVSVSLDGVGEEHDRNRGMEGNFLSAIEVIRTLKQNGLPVSVSCTLTPQNCYSADDVILWCEQNGIQEWIFRLAVDIKRYYNAGYTQRNPYTPAQRFHLIMFFDKLARRRGIDRARRSFYSSLANQLAFGLPRRVRCDWQTRGVTLDMRGNLSFCPAQSAILGSAAEKSAWQVFKHGLPERQRIIHEHCDSCQHDFPGQLSGGELLRRGREIISRKYQQRRLRRQVWSNAPKSILPAAHASPSEWRHVLITGWYGTETTGDKAILGELLHFIKTSSPDCQITLTTLDRKVSQQTSLELADLHDTTLVEMSKGQNPALIESVDAVIIGGGPLMEISHMEDIWRMFVEANRQRKARIVFGCGVGPLYSDRMNQIASGIFQLTTAGFLRDEESYEYAVKYTPENTLGFACDPALAYLRRWVSTAEHRAAGVDGVLRIAGLLRANTKEFIPNKSAGELADSNARAAQQIALLLEPACKAFPAKVDLLPMNAHWLGGDDRIFNRLVASFFTVPEVVSVERAYLPIDALIQSLCSASASIAMRYHGHLFSMALGIPFISIDYTNKTGKVQRLVNRIGYQQWSEDWQAIDSGKAATRLQRLLDERAYWSVYLRQQTELLVSQLKNTYQQVFNTLGVES